MDYSKNNEAKDFLVKVGLSEYVEELVLKNKFETLSDLQLLANLGDNVFKDLNLPLCLVLKIRNELQKPLSVQIHVDGLQPNSSESKTPTLAPTNPKEISTTEVPKVKILELQKRSMEAQFANSQLNKFTGFLAMKVKEFQQQGKWQGAGGLRVSAGTNLKQAQENSLLAQSILNSSEIHYDVYTIPGHGVVTVDRKKGRSFIGNKLSHMRKPSAYKGKNSKDTMKSQRQRSCTKTKPSNEKKSDCENVSQKETPAIENMTENGSPAIDMEHLETEKIIGEVETVPVNDEKSSETTNGCQEERIENELLSRRQENIRLNNMKMLKIGLLTQSQSTIIALFYLGVKQKKLLHMKVLRDECKKQKLPFTKSTLKDELCTMLGKFLFDSKQVNVKDVEKELTFDNLER